MEHQSTSKTIKTIKGFFQQVLTDYQDRNANNLSKLFKEVYEDKGYTMLTAQKWKIHTNFNNYSTIDSLGSSFGSLLESIQAYNIQRLQKGMKDAFSCHLKTIICVLKCLQEMKDRQLQWACKPMKMIIRATKKIFISAYEYCQHDGSSTKIKNDLLNTLQRFKSARSLTPQIKSNIQLVVDNMQVSILFMFHNYEQINRILNIQRSLEKSSNKILNDNFYFQEGKYALVNQNFIHAEKSFQKISIKTKGQKRLIMKYLIPCKIFLGKMFEPKPNNQDQNYPEYQNLMKSIISANFTEYNNIVQKYQKIWIKRGLYLLMDRLRVILWRNLIKRVAQIIGEIIDIQMIQKAVKLAGGDESLNQCICIVSNLIFEGYIKGYIFHSNQGKRILVTKKQMSKAFPKLSVIFGSE